MKTLLSFIILHTLLFTGCALFAFYEGHAFLGGFFAGLAGLLVLVLAMVATTRSVILHHDAERAESPSLNPQPSTLNPRRAE